MRVVSYNVNSLGARLPRLLAVLRAHDPDVVLLQETKCARDAFPHVELAKAGYLAADHSGGRWEGVAVLGRASLGVDVLATGLPGEPEPGQTRWVEARVGNATAVSVYAPNGQKVDSEPFAQKLIFFERMADRAAELAAGDGPVVIGGDMNVCLTDVDAFDPDALHGGTHATDAERTRFRAVLDAGFTDTFRALHPDEPGFSWWDYRAGHFHKGFGLRIDLVLASAGIEVAAAWIDRDFRKPSTVRESKPSDHAPLLVDLALDLQPGPTATDDPVAAARGLAAARDAETPSQLGLL